MKSIELFAGAGGLGMGLHTAGIHPQLVVEWDRNSCQTLRFNQARGHKLVCDWPLVEADVRETSYARFTDQIDIVSGGPPCQPFSVGGKHRADRDIRDMFPEAIRAVREIRPRAFVFENVKGLTRTAFRNYFEYIKLQLEHPGLIANQNESWTDHLSRLERLHSKGMRAELRYNVVARVINAADFGVPQKRERVIFVGFRDDLGLSWAFPEPTHSYDALAWDLASGGYWERHGIPRKNRTTNSRALSRAGSLKEKPSLNAWRTVRDAIHDLPEPEISDVKSRFRNHSFQYGAKSYPGHTGSPFDEPAKTLKAGVHGVPGGENMLLKPDGTVRYFTIRESARLQTFPDDFHFEGSWSESMRQLGNAVPLNLAKVLGASVKEMLSKKV